MLDQAAWLSSLRYIFSTVLQQPRLWPFFKPPFDQVGCSKTFYYQQSCRIIWSLLLVQKSHLLWWTIFWVKRNCNQILHILFFQHWEQMYLLFAILLLTSVPHSIPAPVLQVSLLMYRLWSRLRTLQWQHYSLLKVDHLQQKTKRETKEVPDNSLEAPHSSSSSPERLTLF